VWLHAEHDLFVPEIKKFTFNLRGYVADASFISMREKLAIAAIGALVVLLVCATLCGAYTTSLWLMQSYPSVAALAAPAWIMYKLYQELFTI
jgi:hypothetical protein